MNKWKHTLFIIAGSFLISWGLDLNLIRTFAVIFGIALLIQEWGKTDA